VEAEAMVRGASRLAAAIGIFPLGIGLAVVAVVAVGTSSPELAVSLRAGSMGTSDIAGLRGEREIAVGNHV